MKKFATKNTQRIKITDLENPEWDRGFIHEWKRYVPYEWRSCWQEFTPREKQIIAVICQMQADNEEWD